MLNDVWHIVYNDIWKRTIQDVQQKTKKFNDT